MAGHHIRFTLRNDFMSNNANEQNQDNTQCNTRCIAMSIAYWCMCEHEADRKSLLSRTMPSVQLRETITPRLKSS